LPEYNDEDVNEDGSTDILDLIAIRNDLCEDPEDPGANPRADVNGDGRIDAVDFWQVLYEIDPWP